MIVNILLVMLVILCVALFIYIVYKQGNINPSLPITLEECEQFIEGEDITMNSYTVVLAGALVANTTVTVTTDDPKKIFDLFPNLISITLVEQVK